MIVVTGATGNVGRALTATLVLFVKRGLSPDFGSS
jgi:uncharacterized protein YbjT (DUF2867 family)